jgi:hypothetical protein
VLRRSLSAVVLALLSLGIQNVLDFDFVTPPPPEARFRARPCPPKIGCERSRLPQIGSRGLGGQNVIKSGLAAKNRTREDG